MNWAGLESTLTTGASLLAGCAIIWSYALIINSKFGHSSYWRQRQHPPQAQNFVSQNKKLSLSHRHHEFQINNIEDSAILCSLSFLTASEILHFSHASRECLAICCNAWLWDQLMTSACNQVDHKFLSKYLGRGKLGFFEAIKQYPFVATIDTDKAFTIIISGHLYLIPQSFLEEHPGGNHIILEYRNKDATSVFELAYHSTLAKTMASAFLIWSPVTWVGKLGHPKFANSDKIKCN